jgi:hypothetical protein
MTPGAKWLRWKMSFSQVFFMASAYSCFPSLLVFFLPLSSDQFSPLSGFHLGEKVLTLTSLDSWSPHMP